MKKINIKHPVEFTLNKIPNGTNCEHIVYEKEKDLFLISRKKLDDATGGTIKEWRRKIDCGGKHY